MLNNDMSEILEEYINGNLSWARDEFWGQNRTTMRNIMLEANNEMSQKDLDEFIRVIFLP